MDSEIIQNDFTDWKKKIIKFLAGQTISLFGSLLVQYAIVWYITLETKSGSIATITILVSFLPQVFISLFAGVWADRYDKKKLIIYSDGMIAISTLILAILFFCNIRYLWLIFIMSAIRSLGSGIQMPAVSSLIPELVPEDKLMRINGINATIQSLMMIVGPVIAGGLLSVAKIEVIFFIDVVTAFIAILLLATLKIKHKEHEEKETNHINQIKEGFKYLMGHKVIKKLLMFYALLSFLFTPIAFLTTLMVTRSFGPEVWRLTVHETVFGLGSIIGGVVISVWGGFKNRIYTMVLACFVFGTLSVGMGFSSVFIAYLIFMFLAGIIMPFFNSASIVYFQENVEPEVLGRVFGFVQIVSTIAMPLGMLIFGPLADVMKIEYLLIVSGILTMILSIAMYYNKTFKIV